jgi:hypothetical protein
MEGHVSADALFLGEREIFSVEHRPTGIALRTSRGAYLGPGPEQDVSVSESSLAATLLVIDPYHQTE